MGTGRKKAGQTDRVGEMVTRELIEKLIGKRLSEVLLIAEAALPQSQFQAFRKLTLDQFGNSGLGKDLDEAFGRTKSQRWARDGQAEAMQKRE